MSESAGGTLEWKRGSLGRFCWGNENTDKGDMTKHYNINLISIRQSICSSISISCPFFIFEFVIPFVTCKVSYRRPPSPPSV